MNLRIYPEEFYNIVIQNLNKINAHKKFLEENTRRVIVEKIEKPQIPYISIRDVEESIRVANSSDYGLATIVYGRRHK